MDSGHGGGHAAGIGVMFFFAVVAMTGCTDGSASSSCYATPDCPGGQYCGPDNRCTYDCTDDRDCTGGVCSSLGQCVGADGDAGPDGDDGGVVDAGPGDGDGGLGSGDAGPACQPTTSDPGIAGEHYLAISPVIAPDDYLRFIATVKTCQDAGGVAMEMALQPLCAREGTGDEDCGDDYLQPVGTVLDVAIASASEATFLGTFSGTIPGKANPFSGSQISTSGLTLDGTISSEDFFCGDVSGTLDEPIPNLDMAGSTFGAIRIAPGTLGDSLPLPAPSCGGQVSMPDAGPTPDAATPDAG